MFDQLGSVLECDVGDDKDDDEDVYEGVWGAISTTLIIYGSIGIVMLIIFEYSKSNKDVYHCGRGTIDLPSDGFLKWLKPLIQINKNEVLQIAGMDGFVLIRFLNQCLKISFFSFIVSLFILFPTYLSANGKLTNSFARGTMDNVLALSNKLWIPFICTYAITLFVLWTIKSEWDLYVSSRLEFLKFGDPHVPDIAKFTVRVESIPKELQSDEKLLSYFNDIFPHSVSSAMVQLSNTDELIQEIENAKNICIQLETFQAKKIKEFQLYNSLKEKCVIENPPKEPTIFISKKKLNKNKRLSNSNNSIIKSNDTLDERRLEGELNELEASPSSPLSSPSNNQNKNQNFDHHEIENGMKNDEKIKNDLKISNPINTSQSSESQVSLNETSNKELKEYCSYQEVYAIPYYKTELDLINYKVKKLQSDIKMNQNKNNLSSTGFVTFKTRQSASDAVLILLDNDLKSKMIIYDATDPKNIIWDNISDPISDYKTRHSIISVVVRFFALFLFIPLLVFCNIFGNIDKLSQIPGLEGLKSLKEGSFLYDFITTQVPPILQSTLVGLLPVIFEYIAIAKEKMKLQSMVQRSVLDRGFGFQLVNIYFTLLGSSLASTIGLIVSQPECVFELLGASVPAVASYFCQLILINALLGLTMQLSRPVPLLLYKINKYFENKNGISEIAKEQYEESLVYFDGGAILPGFLLVAVLGLTYSVMVPFFNIITTIYFSIAYIVFKYNILFVYIPKCETGGLLFPTLENYLLTGLNFANITMMGYMFIKGGFAQFVFLIPLIVLVENFRGHVSSFYLRKSESIGRKEAVALDKLQGDYMDTSTGKGGATDETSLKMGGLQRSILSPEEEIRISNIQLDYNAYRQPCLLHRSYESAFERIRGDDHSVLSESQFEGSISHQAF